MAMLLRHLFAIVTLPLMVTVVVPLWIAERYDVKLFFGRSIGFVTLQVVGLVLFNFGLIVFLASLQRFAVDGKGTLAPWDPPRVFVVRGVYQFVRNPMISGIIMLLFGEAVVLLSLAHAIWAVGFLALNLLYIPVVEEPQLERRFGESYREYCRHVPRFIPRFSPWRRQP